ncbi:MULTISPECIES: sulfurtransferase TusA family protein [Sporosarcina]|uniref:Response regulator n=1 Tax=Sporosarcina newyorkensis 2681 TaxID=1027292 RepID=F9DS74_9BACL|nr:MULTISPECIES: sulfurtransferase TusA family protein [Sporosarcina]EGQ26374.1 response regulator [Sporosarcina newyorkensis 2681]MBY0223728.1 sulfurtransferase TusA family protein [Sporosarcina aquimarina]
MIQTDRMLDAKGLACPMPIVRTRKAMKDMLEGQVLEVQSTDPGTVADLQAWAKSAGHHYVGNVQEADVWHHYVRKADNGELQEKKYPVTIMNEQLTDKLREPNTVLLDVREPTEYAFSHIPGALSVPLGQLEEKAAYFDKNQNIFVICRTGNRSDMACQTLSEAGFEFVTNVVPGMSGWNGDTENTTGGTK